jgi:hypothetical protein
LALLVGAGFGDYPRRGHRRQKRSADRRAAELLEHDGQLGRPVALAAESLLDVQAQPAGGNDVFP